MSRKSVHIPAPEIHDDIIEVRGDEHRHLAVARAESGEIVEAFDGTGVMWIAEVLGVDKHRTRLRIREKRELPKPAVELILGQAMIRTAAFEQALEKAVEIGITRIVPFMASRSNVAPEGRSERWHRIVVGAAKQSKHFHLPKVDAVTRFEEVLRIDAPSRILFAEKHGGSLRSALCGAPVLYLIGPEGGWSDQEIERAGHAGFQPVSMGAGILRAETAAVVGAALIRYELGDMA